MNRSLMIEEVNPEVKCWRRRIYDDDTDDYMDAIENSSAPIISKVLNGNASTINSEDEKVLREFIWALHMRSLEWGDVRDQPTGQSVEKASFDEESMRQVRRIWLRDDPDLMTPLPKSQAMDFVLFYFKNETDVKFCTSDCPAYRLSLDKSVTIDTYRPDGDGTGILLPLSPEYAVVAVPNTRAVQEPWSKLPKVIKVLNHDFVALVDLMTCFNSEKLVFGVRRDELDQCAYAISQAPSKVPKERLFLDMLEKEASKH